MKYEKYKKNEEGFLLLESIITLVIIMAVILFLNPLATHWLSIRQQAKDTVEKSRQFYEESMEINNSFFVEKDQIKTRKTEVVIYESKFEYE